MASPKLFTSLQVLSKEEWLSFRKYLLMYTRAESHNFQCFSLLAERQNQLQEEGLEEHLRLQYFPTLSPKRFSNVLSKLFQWFEDWFAIHSFKKEKFAKEVALVRRYNQRGLFTLANKHSARIISEIKKSDRININDQETLTKIYHYQYYSNNPIKRINKDLLNNCITAYLKNITNTSSNYLMDIVHTSTLREQEFDKSQKILRDIIEITPSTEISGIVNSTVSLLKNKDEVSFNALKEALESQILDEESDLYIVLTAYLRRYSVELWLKDNSFSISSISQVHQMYYDAIEKNKHQYLLPITLFNGVSSLGAILSYNETELFIQKWAPKVHTEHKDSALKFCQALNAFRHDQYKEIPSLVSSLEFDNPVSKLTSRVLNIIAMYKLSDEYTLVNLVNNYKIQLKRNSYSAPPFLIKRLSNLVEIILLMNKAKRDKSIVINLEKYQPVFYQHWVVKELNK